MPAYSWAEWAAAGALAGLFATATQAADLRPPADPWSGFHVGGFVGAVSDRAAQGYSIASPLLAGLPPIIPVIEASGAQPIRASGVQAGVEGGYDWRVAPGLLLGVAADVDASGAHGQRNVQGIVPIFGAPYEIRQGLGRDWGASLRLRAGLAALDSLLLYATGGVAVAQFRYAQGFWDPVPEVESVSRTSTRLGWTLGGGAQWALSRAWSLKAEYRHSGYSGFSMVGASMLADGSTALTTHSTGALHEDTVRLGVDYRFP